MYKSILTEGGGEKMRRMKRARASLYILAKMTQNAKKKKKEQKHINCLRGCFLIAG